jgi:DNA polymerase-1
MNLQQIPSKGEEGKEMRKCFIAPDGEMLITSDISSAELRIIAELSQDPLWLNAYRNGEDLHSVLCSEVFKIPIGDVKTSFPMKPDLTYRDVIKTINFG